MLWNPLRILVPHFLEKLFSFTTWMYVVFFPFLLTCKYSNDIFISFGTENLCFMHELPKLPLVCTAKVRMMMSMCDLGAVATSILILVYPEFFGYRREEGEKRKQPSSRLSKVWSHVSTMRNFL